MNLRFLFHSLLIMLSTLIPVLWNQNKLLSPYALQLCGAITILYIVCKKLLGLINHEFNQNILTILTANSIAGLLIISTGGVASPLFFLYYFLIFAFAFVYESYQAVTVALTIVFVYLLEFRFELGSGALANLFSLLLISPLAQSFSKSMIKNLEAEGKIRRLEGNISKEETDSLLWLSTEAKPTINSVINSITDVIIFLKSSRHEMELPKNFLDKIKSIQTDLITLYSSSEDLEDTIKESSDNKTI